MRIVISGKASSAPFQQGAAPGQVLLRGHGHGDRQRPSLAHGGEQRWRDELVLDGPPLPAALHPDVAGAHPVAQREQGGGLPDAAVFCVAVAAAVQHRVAPGRAQEAGRQVLRPLAAAAAVGRLQQLHRVQRRRRGGHGAELEGVEEQGAEPVQHGPGARGQRRQVHLVRAGQALGLGDAGRQPLPIDLVRDGAVQVGIALLCCDQGAAGLSEVNAKAAADTLEDVRISGGKMEITPLKAITPEAAEDAAERLYAMLPNARITAVLDDVHR